MIDVERLIELVKKNQFLYDISHKDYKNPNLKIETWELIGKELNATSENCRLKWKTVRDSYIQYKKQLKKSDGTKEIDYIWSGNLKFLDSHNVNRRSFRDNVHKQKPETEFVSDELIYGAPSSPPPLAPLGSLTMADVSSALSQPNQDLRINVLDPNPKCIAMDATDLLFLSYSASFKKFPARQQTFMKLELAKLFANAELNQLDDSELNTADAIRHSPVIIKTEHTFGVKSENSNGSRYE